MLRKGLKIFAILTITVVLALLVPMLFQSSDYIADPLSMYDDTTQCIIQINNLPLLQKNTYSQELENFFQSYLKDTSNLLSHMSKHLKPTIKKIYLGIDSYGTTTSTFYFGDILESETWTNSFLEANKNIYAGVDEKYLGNTIHTFTLDKASYYLCETMGLVICSESLLQVKKSIDLLQPENTENPTWSKLTETLKLSSRVADANVYFNLRQTNTENPPFYSEAGWCVLDLWVKNNVLLLNGFSNSIQQLGLAQSIENSSPSDPFLHKILPENAESSFILSLPSDRISTSVLSPTYIQQFIENYGINPIEFIQRIYGGEISYSTCDGEKIIAIKITGESVTNYLLQAIVKKAQQSDVPAEETTYIFDNQTIIPIYEFDWLNLSGLLFGTPFASTGKQFSAIVNNTLFIATKKNQIIEQINNQLRNKTLWMTEEYLPLRSNMSTNSNLIFYSSNDPKLLYFWLNPTIAKKIQNKGTAISMVWQISTEINKPYHNIVLNFPVKTISGQIINENYTWKSRLTGTAISKPLIINNKATGKPEFLIQDNTNTLYLLNEQGRIVWDKKIDGPILGSISAPVVDKNGNYTLLFNTARYIYRINPDGTVVSGFPTEIPHEASCGLGIFDYELDLNYRLCLALKNRQILLYDIQGKPIAGWEFKTTDAMVTTPPQHFRIANKDYILTGDTLRIYILDRRGKERVRPNTLMGKSPNNLFYYSQARKRWFTTTPQGDLMSITTEGLIRTEKITSVSPSHYYLYADFLADNKGSHIFVDSTLLLVANSAGEKVFTYQFKGNITDFPAIYQFSSSVYGLGIVDKTDNKVFLFARNGNQLYNFPLHGITPFSITKDLTSGEFRLIVGHNDGFVYNIKIR